MLDEQGAEYWRATWDAAGWRTISTQAADMQVWFGLPGQLLLPYTYRSRQNGACRSAEPSIFHPVAGARATSAD